jgi:hypothetical protein
MPGSLGYRVEVELIWTGADTMTMNLTCDHLGCHRSFVSEKAMSDHAAVVHFSDITEVVRAALKETYERVFVVDISPEVVVFEAVDEQDWDFNMYRCSYSIDAQNVVTFGDCTEVIRVVTYEDKVDSMDGNTDGNTDSTGN